MHGILPRARVRKPEDVTEHQADDPRHAVAVHEKLVGGRDLHRAEIGAHAVEQEQRVLPGNAAPLHERLERCEEGTIEALARVNSGKLVVKPRDALGSLAERSEVDLVIGRGDTTRKGRPRRRAKCCRGAGSRAQSSSNGWRCTALSAAFMMNLRARSSITSLAVALPEFTTPGTPAPGCVPAPTR